MSTRTGQTFFSPVHCQFFFSLSTIPSLICPKYYVVIVFLSCSASRSLACSLALFSLPSPFAWYYYLTSTFVWLPKYGYGSAPILCLFRSIFISLLSCLLLPHLFLPSSSSFPPSLPLSSLPIDTNLLLSFFLSGAIFCN
ncbi:uncharacterized protein BO80DRAFT_10851 [Aspergillus ibericus CBS 121593]|uniref:Uncharacterized protein n=1 Tax=Aspergillus ibericus CBS 121593 TaxID=1448316 RepID=A0A395HEV6_9EURO|nr:hypothetical protein BO80DRAFT_10851 [Aspergillus ibericus CBS 121593]RAL06377.1 hypothetical protein BO80DRAFT_10851 [Aspergillus ibericus CBS 121593]